MNTSMGATRAWLSFDLASRRCAVPLVDVREILDPRPVTPVPGAPADVLGIIHLRGHFVTVLDGRQRLGLAPGEADDDARLVIFFTGDQALGVRVDAVRDVLTLDASGSSPSIHGVDAGGGGRGLGTLQQGDDVVTLLDARQLGGLDPPAAGGTP